MSPRILSIRLLLAGMLSCGLAQAQTSTSPGSTENDWALSSSKVPADVSVVAGADMQMSVNQHAWKTFISLMWAADPNYRGQPDYQQRPGPGVTRVWETMKEQYEVYMPDGSPPPPWNAPQPIPQACRSYLKTDRVGRVLYRSEKVDDVLDSVAQAVKADGTLPGTLTDQNGKVVRYEIRFNQTVFDYIVENGLYNGQVQAEVDNITYPDGSIIVKAAWKELSDEEIDAYQDHFMTRDACICEDGTYQQCYVAKTGLVGFHVMQKTPSAPQWIWSTFEHLANVAPSHGVPASFNNPNCQGPHCVPNSQTETGTPNQVTQILPIAEELQQLNAQLQQLFDRQGWLLGNYQLMSAQWPIQQAESAEHPTVFAVQPTFSANTTMETFAQSSSSCMGCHVMSRSTKPDVFVSGDFTFTLNNANPKPAGATCEAFDYSNSIFCSEDLLLFNESALEGFPPQLAQQITRGHTLATQTYEQMPNNVGNRLHCSSCHLHGGGDPKAAWWVDMLKVYKDAEGLHGRINGCFERSMNGHKLCTPGSDCNNNQDMVAIIAYMEWLTLAFRQQQDCNLDGSDCPTPARGFPELTSSVIGNVATGEAIYEQKCAFCHNDLGEGRYESDTYFRPALWGPDSFRANAGMARPDMLAKFLRWNMPYTSGGLLTDQEAQDLACFIDAQQRPDKLTFGNGDNAVCAGGEFSKAD